MIQKGRVAEVKVKAGVLIMNLLKLKLTIFLSLQNNKFVYRILKLLNNFKIFLRKNSPPLANLNQKLLKSNEHVVAVKQDKLILK